ncbi:MAG: hypothetical protein WC516_05565 [Patescibacteria group bacterium]|jgi:phage shock protein A
MEITGSVLTGLFVGLVWALIKVVEFFIKKYGKSKEDIETNVSANKLAETQTNQFKDISEKISQIKDFCILTKEQSDKLDEIWQKTKKLEDMHNVYNENHAPAWYIPTELLPLVRESNICLENLEKSLDIAIDEIKAGHVIVVNRISDLITSQKLVTERLGDLISALNKFSR